MTHITYFKVSLAAFHQTNLDTSFWGFFSFPCVHQYLSFSAMGNTSAMLDSVWFRWRHLQWAGAWSVLYSTVSDSTSVSLPVTYSHRHDKKSALLMLLALKLVVK